MNRELYIHTLQGMRDVFAHEHMDTQVEALEAAIHELERPTDGDCISRQAAIDMIEKYFNGLPIAVHYDMIAMIHRLPTAQPEPQWIPCSERLPEKVFSEHANAFIYPTVIICDESGRVTAGFYYEYVDGGSYWYDLDAETEINDVVAWMPLPEPWRGEEHDDC